MSLRQAVLSIYYLPSPLILCQHGRVFEVGSVVIDGNLPRAGRRFYENLPSSVAQAGEIGFVVDLKVQFLSSPAPVDEL